MNIKTKAFTFDNIPCCFLTKRYYDELQYTCTIKDGTSTLNFTPGGPGLLIQKYGFTIAEQYELNKWRELNYQYFNAYRVSLLINYSPVEGYSAKIFPVSGFLKSDDIQSCTVLDPSKLCDLSYLIENQENVPIQVTIQNINLPENACIIARIVGRWVS